MGLTMPHSIMKLMILTPHCSFVHGSRISCTVTSLKCRSFWELSIPWLGPGTDKLFVAMLHFRIFTQQDLRATQLRPRALT